LRWEVVIYHLIAPIKSKKVRDVGWQTNWM
jgi:hypothetical protein